MKSYKISRTPRLRKIKLHKWVQFLILVGIFGFFGVYRVDNVFRSGNFITQRHLSDLIQERTASFKNFLANLEVTGNDRSPDLEVQYEIRKNSKEIYPERTENETEKGRTEDNYDMNNKNSITNVDEDINALVKAYYASSNDSTVEVTRKTSSPGNALYSEVPPDYNELLKVVMDISGHCKDANDYEAIIAVHSAPNHFENRAAFRWLYGDFERTDPYRFKLVFFIGLVRNSTLQDQLKKENEEYGDTVQGNFIDAYINMTYKAIMVFKYLDTHCPGVKGLFRVDDDVFMNMQKVYPRWAFIQRHRKTKTILCHRLKNDQVMRTGKWAVPESLIPGKRYDFIRCPGFFSALTVDLIHDMSVQAQKAPFFWIDDIVMLGLVPNSIGGVFFYPFSQNMAGAHFSNIFYQCIKRSGPDCPYWVGITDVRRFQKLYGWVSGSMPLVKVTDQITV